MLLAKALFKYGRIPVGSEVIDTTQSGGRFRELSPFVLPAPPAKTFENLWQFSKVYPEYADADGNPLPSFYEWQKRGWESARAYRYPVGKGRKPLYSLWGGLRLGYIEARKNIYIPVYAENVRETASYRRLEEVYQGCLDAGKLLVLLDFDAYDHEALGMSLKAVVNNPGRKMGHAFVLVMMLTGQMPGEE